MSEDNIGELFSFNPEKKSKFIYDSQTQTYSTKKLNTVPLEGYTDANGEVKFDASEMLLTEIQKQIHNIPKVEVDSKFDVPIKLNKRTLDNDVDQSEEDLEDEIIDDFSNIINQCISDDPQSEIEAAHSAMEMFGIKRSNNNTNQNFVDNFCRQCGQFYAVKDKFCANCGNKRQQG